MPAVEAPLLPAAGRVVGCAHARPMVVGADTYTPDLPGTCDADEVLAAGVTAAPSQSVGLRRGTSPLGAAGCLVGERAAAGRKGGWRLGLRRIGHHWIP